MVNPSRNQLYDITIQCSLDGFCFVVFDTETKLVVEIKTYQTSDTGDETAILKAIEKYFYDHGLYGLAFHSIRFIVSNRFNTLIPESLFDEEHIDYLLQFNHLLPHDYEAYHDTLHGIDSINMFAVPTKLAQRIRNNWPDIQIHHESSVFLNSVLRLTPDESPKNVFVNVRSRNFDLAIVEDGKLLFYNNFKFNTKEDFIYYLMFTLEQQQLAGQDIPVHFTGLITNNSEIVKLCERYIRRIRFIRPDGNIGVDTAFCDIPFQYYYIPYQSLTCEL